MAQFPLLTALPTLFFLPSFVEDNHIQQAAK
jgi:hypothetical protein